VRVALPEPQRIILSMYLTRDGYNEFPSYPGSEPPPAEPDQVADAMWAQRWGSFDTLLFDRATYEQWAEFWPLSKRAPDEHPWFRQMSEFAEGAQKVILSDDGGPAAWANPRTIAGDLSTAVAQLPRELGGQMVVVAPGLGRDLMRLGLIDEYLFAVMPVLLGKGHSFFGELESQQTPRLVEVKRCTAGELFLHYETAR
jgi:dihydrofolate reductase